jgi:hypothetical protein
MELNDGTVFARRITSATQDGDEIVLIIDAELDFDVSPSDIRQFCFMKYVRSDQDKFDFVFTGGMRCTMTFTSIEIPFPIVGP